MCRYETLGGSNRKMTLWSFVVSFLQVLEKNWRTIRDEALSVMDQNTGMFVPEEENLREKGEWGQYTLWQQGTETRTLEGSLLLY